MDIYNVFADIPLVIDNGSSITKAGLGTEDMPKLIFPTYNFKSIARPKYKSVMPHVTQSEYYIGNQLDKEEKRGIMKFSYPMKHGQIDNFDDMKLIWNYIFSELKVQPQDYPLMLTEPPNSSFSLKAQILQQFIENYNVPGFFIANQGLLSLYASGNTSGIVLDSGDGVTYCMPVYEGFSLGHASQRIDLAGREITEYLQLLLRRAGYSFNTTAEFEIVKKIKEERCQVSSISSDKQQPLFSQNIQQELMYQKDENIKLLGQEQYRLPDGQSLNISSEKYIAPEILFYPEKIGMECSSIPELIIKCIKKCDIDLRKTLFQTIVLAGGTTLLRGFPQRLIIELRKEAPADIQAYIFYFYQKFLQLKLYSKNDRQFLCWMGGSLLGKLSSFKNLWITKKDYEEFGNNILYRKCY